MARTSVRRLVAAAALGLASTLVAVPAAAGDRAPARHVLLLSVDGLHQTDLAFYVRQHPGSALARLVRGGVEFTRAEAPVPSDSFPGLIAQVTGGNPASTGIYYDDTFNHALLPAGTTSCAGVQPNAEVTYFEQLDRDQHSLDAGQGLAGLPGSILQMTGSPTTLIDPAQLPVDPTSCRPVFPHQYLKVNTIFEVARAARLRTAWSDKHPAYEVLNGPSGTGVQDLFTPEINSDAPIAGSSNDWTTDNALTQQYDNYKVEAVINEIEGFDHSGTTRVGTPAIFGMNFQTVSTAQKLPVSDGLKGGYLADGVTPGPLLSRALDFINSEVGAMLAAISRQHLERSTAVILSAKHGQSPQDPAKLTRIPDGPIMDALDAAWQAAHPAATQPLVLGSVNDDGMVIWLTDRSQAAADFAKQFLLDHSGTGNDINGNPKAYTASGLRQVFAGEAAADFFHAKPGDPRVPDVFGVSQVGVVYTGGKKKIAEHGGDNPQDRDVPLVVSGAPVGETGVEDDPVETTQIAPTILRLLGLDPRSLKSVRIEGTRTLPLG
ncbi:MAG TPA: alkaline phosphatase family protein [Terriglobales bacterium]|nr:alkaline phosphatase family protein [Terriglobales bacterium]